MRIRLYKKARALERDLATILEERLEDWDNQERALLRARGGMQDYLESYAVQPPIDYDVADLSERITRAFQVLFQGLEPEYRKPLADFFAYMEASDPIEDDDATPQADAAKEKKSTLDKRLDNPHVTLFRHLADLAENDSEISWLIHPPNSSGPPSKKLIFTPLRNPVQLHVLSIQQKIQMHPWAHFLLWFSELPHQPGTRIVYSEVPAIHREGVYSIQFIAPPKSFRDSSKDDPHIIAPHVRLSVHPQCQYADTFGERFWIYGDLSPQTTYPTERSHMTEAMIQHEFKRLQIAVQHLHS